MKLWPRERDVLLAKIDEWRSKGNAEQDAFNRYISLFIAFNVFYNLYAKTQNERVDLNSRDGEHAISTLNLISDKTQLYEQIRTELEDYSRFIPIYREEFWGRENHRVAISDSLRQSVQEHNADQAIEMMMKWLYKVRCNLVHGEKDFNDLSQKELLAKSSTLLDKYLVSVLERYRAVYGGAGGPLRPEEIWTVDPSSVSVDKAQWSSN